MRPATATVSDPSAFASNAITEITIPARSERWTISADSVSVDKEPIVGEVALGVAGRFRKCEFGWSFTWLTDEFDAQDHGDAFGTVWFTWRTEF